MTLPIPTKPIDKKEPSRLDALVPAGIALLAIFAVVGYMFYDQYVQDHLPPPPVPTDPMAAYPGGVDVESDYLIHSFQGQPLANELTLQPGDVPLDAEPLHMPPPADPKATHENSFKRQMMGMTEEVSVWTTPNMSASQVADFYRDAARAAGLDQRPSPNSFPTRPMVTTRLSSLPEATTRPSNPRPLGPNDPPSRRLSPIGANSIGPSPRFPTTQADSSQTQPGHGSMNLIFLRRPVLPTMTQPSYIQAQVLVVRIRPLKNGGARLVLWARYASPASLDNSTQPDSPQPDSMMTR